MNARFFGNLKVLVADALCLFCVHDLVEASDDVSTCDPLEHDSSLHQQATVGDLYCHFFPFTGPKEQPRITRLSMDSDEVEIVVETSKGSADVVLHQIASCRCQQVVALLHAVRESVLWQAHADSNHLCGGRACVNHMVTPAVHLLFPLGLAIGYDLGQIVAHCLRALTDRPEETPFCIVFSWIHRQWLITLGQTHGDSFVVSRSFYGFGSDADLPTELGSRVRKLTCLVVDLGHLFKVVLHHVDVLIVV